MAGTTTIKMPGTPPPWANAAMTAMLRTPGVRRLLGRAFALITVTGAKSGRRYTTPVQYMRLGDRYVVLSQRMRTWWRNIPTMPAVGLLVAGREIEGQATVAADDEASTVLTEVLRANPRVARFYGIDTGPGGTIEAETVDDLLRRVVVILIS